MAKFRESAYMVETFHNLNFLLPPFLVEELFPSVFLPRAGIHHHPDSSVSTHSQFSSLQIDRLFGWREGLTRRERGPLAAEDQAVEGHLMFLRSTGHEHLDVAFVIVLVCLVMLREMDVKGEPILPQYGSTSNQVTEETREAGKERATM
jgi:hypothetical protein